MNEILQLILIEVQPVAVAVMAAAAAVAIGPVVVRKNVTVDPSSSVKHPHDYLDTKHLQIVHINRYGTPLNIK